MRKYFFVYAEIYFLICGNLTPCKPAGNAGSEKGKFDGRKGDFLGRREAGFLGSEGGRRGRSVRAEDAEKWGGGLTKKLAVGETCSLPYRQLLSVRLVRPYFFCLTTKLIRKRMTMAPIAPVKIDPTQPSPSEVPKTSAKSQEPTPLPRMPTMMFPRRPSPLPR